MISVKTNDIAINILQGNKKDFDIYLYDIKYYPQFYNIGDFKNQGGTSYVRMSFIKNLRDDPTFMKKCTAEVRNDLEFMLMAVRIRHEAFEFVSERLKNVRCMVESAI